MTNRHFISAAVVLLAFSPAMVLSMPAEAFSLSLGGSSSASAGSSSGSTSANGSASLSLGTDLGLSSAGSASGSSTSTTGASTTTASTSASGSATSSANSDVETAISLIENNNWTAGTLSGTGSVSGGSTIDVAPLLNATTKAELDQALSANSTDVGNLQTALSNNAAISAFLAGQNVSASNVIAVGQTANGSLTFFTLQ